VHRAPAGEDLVATGGRLDRSHLVAGYVAGAFPMGLGPSGSGALGWFSPDPRGVLRPSRVHESRSLRRRSRDFSITVDLAFDDVVAGCADPDRPGRWITAGYLRAYRELHDAGLAHSIEVWEGDQLAGGLFGVAVGGMFAAESKFHRASGASKAAVIALARICAEDGDERRVIDVQWRTDHLASLGVEEMSRSQYLRRLSAAVRAPLPPRLAEAAVLRTAGESVPADLEYLLDAQLV
jgi:leucyl/phenylalanyl-tRNA--protein transferase